MKTRVIIAISLASGAVAGCSASTDEYVDDVNKIQAEVVKASKSVGSDLNASKQELLDQLDTAKTEADEAVTDLEDIDVPEDAEKGHEELIKGFEDLEKLYDDVRKGIESESSAAFDELQTKRAQIEKQIDQALGQINDELGLK